MFASVIERLRRWVSAWPIGAAAAVVLALTVHPVSDSDLGFHLATGREILATGHIPTVNVLSFAEPTHPWLIDEALPTVLLEIAWRAAGATGLWAVGAILVVAAVFASGAAARRAGAGAAAVGAALVLAGWASIPRLNARPFLFSNLTTLLAVAASFGALRALVLSDGRRVRRAFGLATAALVAGHHLHAGAIFGEAALLAIACGAGVQALWEPQRRATWISFAKGCVISSVAGLALGFVSLALYQPSAWAIVALPFTLGADGYLVASVVEFRSVFAFPWEVFAGFWLILAGVAIAGAWCVRARQHFWLVMPATMGVILAARHVRFVDLGAWLSVPLLAVAWNAAVEQWVRVRGERFARPVSRMAAALVALGALVDRGDREPFALGLAAPVWPEALLAPLQSGSLRGPVFASDGWAGPMLGLLYPRERAFFDPRFEAYSPAHWRVAYQDTRYGKPGWDATLDRFGVELVLLKYTSPGERERQGGAPNLRQRLVQDPRWMLVQFDDTGATYARRAGVNRQAAALPGIDPDRLELVGPPGPAAAALQAALSRGQDSERLRLLLVLALDADGRHAEALAAFREGRAAWPAGNLLTSCSPAEG